MNRERKRYVLKSVSYLFFAIVLCMASGCENISSNNGDTKNNIGHKTTPGAVTDQQGRETNSGSAVFETTPGAVTDQQEEETVSGSAVGEELSVTQIDMYYPGDHLTTFMEEEDIQNVLDVFREMKLTKVDPVEKSGFMFGIDIIYENGERDDTVIDGKHIVVNGVHGGYYRCARSYCEEFRKLYEKFSKKQAKG